MTAKAVPNPQAADRAKAFGLTPVSRETEERLGRFVDLLLKWQQTTHLISTSTVPKLWTRHVADSLQLLDLAPSARLWVDLGSGGGFRVWLLPALSPRRVAPRFTWSKATPRR